MQIYNFQYLLDLNDKTYELKRIVDTIDMHISQAKTPYIFHLVPILYSVAFTSGLTYFLYSLANI